MTAQKQRLHPNKDLDFAQNTRFLLNLEQTFFFLFFVYFDSIFWLFFLSVSD